MALGADGISAMLGQAVADRLGAGDIGVNGGHDIRRRWRRHAQDVLRHPDTTRHGRGLHTIGADREHRCHPEQAAAMIVAFKTDLLEAIGEPQRVLLGQVVELGELLVHEGMISVEKL